MTIYDAKANLSKLVKQAQAGKTIYIGAYGQPQAAIVPLPPKKNKIKFGVLAHLADPDYDYDALIGPDEELNALIEESINRPFPS